MTILSNKQIVDRLGDSVIIDPFNPANVNTSSYDVTLGEYYFVERKTPLWRRLLGRPEIYNIWDYDEVRRRWGNPLQARPARHYGLFKNIRHNERIIFIPPKRTILAHTIEFIGGREPIRVEWETPWQVELPSTTMMKARSSYGRNGIEVCKCAGYGDVGYFNRWTMEITNNLHCVVPLIVGRRIAQIVFMETGMLTKGDDYTGSGKYQDTKSLAELKAAWRPGMILPRLDRDRDNNPT